MPDVDLLVVGGGAAGAAAVNGYRSAGGEGPVALVTQEPTPPYQRPPLSKDFLRGETTVDGLGLDDPPDARTRTLLDTRVTRLNPAGHLARLHDGNVLTYRACVVATGNGSRQPPVSGADDPGLFQLRSLADAQRLRTAAAKASTAVVVGSGFIGCEAACSLARLGVAVTVVSQEELPQVDRLGPFAAGRIAGWLDETGVRLRPGVTISTLAPERVCLTDGTTLAADLILVAAGIEPRTELLRPSELLDDRGTIAVDDHMACAAPDLYAAGDIVSAWHPVAGRRLTVEHWGDAVTMGGIAGANAAGADRTWTDVPGFWTELGERTLKYHAWGDGFDDSDVVEHGPDAFTVWYRRDGAIVGVLTYNADDDDARAADMIVTAARART